MGRFPMISRRRFAQGALASLAAGLSPIAFRAAKANDGFLEITAGPSAHKLYRDEAAASNLWTYNGSLPGPAIRARRGERIKVRLINKLEEATSIHWHGIRIENAMDGVSGLTQMAVPPGESFEYDFASPDAGTFWYHAHNKSWNQVGRGLYGPLIIEGDDEAFDVEHDLTLMLDDWRLDESGKLHEASFGSLMDWSHAGRLGNWLTVNGMSLPSFDLVAGASYRVRLINASNARILELDLAGLGAKLLALDGQSVGEPAPIAEAGFLLGPAQRADIMITPETGSDWALKEVSSGDPFDIATFRIVPGGSGAPMSAKYALQPNDVPEPDLASARVLKLDMTGGAMGMMGDMVYKGQPLTRELMRETGQLWAFNGTANLADEPFFQAGRGETIILDVVNNTAFAHAMHSHGHHFKILEQSRALVEDTGFFRDTVLVDAGERVRIAFVADNPGKWLFHCHMLEHAAAGMNTWFEVA
ncbi:multicopper oxidase family protein [Roseibium sp.]|uniref:multicopper oxidase family protein n=1 Tax=Roseibium sp. TaxID=1936156 RepID=UPI003A97923C